MINLFVAPSHRTRSNFVNIIRTFSTSIRPNIELEMRKFNNQKEFNKTLDLFDEYRDHEKPTSRIIVQALRACVQLGFLKRGQDIHKKLPNELMNDVYIQTSLIHLYSKFVYCWIKLK